jgi:radical SAM protein with 4Fe4S-binding SPASM domain
LFCSRAATDLVEGDLPESLLNDVISLSRWSKELVLFGYGEPLIARSFYRLLREARSGRVSFVTNGLALTPRLFEKMLATSRRPIYYIAFSIDGVTSSTYEWIRPGSNFSTVWANLKAVAQLKVERDLKFPKLWIEFVAMRHNIAELPDLVQQAAAIGVNQINVFNLIVWSEQYKEESLIFSPKLAEKYFAQARKVALEAGITLDLPVIPAMAAEDGQGRKLPICYEPWSYTYIKYDGTVMACCFAEELVMGNLKEESFEAIWNGSRYQELRAIVNQKPPEVCLRCEHRFRYVNSPSDFMTYIKLKPRSK